ncbi:Ferric enterobactin esterase [Citrobacter werkmanii]|uniref:Ferric enterobactin esterase n=1 Tax=Citrobacter werkmanii TaxID=67827 RepID=A0A9N8CJP5_9ENTR|nr:enterochelin esterase [Citrobacter werkmanii]CAB5518377.1 Ferric enterobactin esterase [Citrobacter werkmanii]CAB5523201.1 Ferric enterobactin esterase [Citrobacter werkmanii]CAB5531681.1 Ferric enterobactin esterase [Citrobacter werkmanii]CAB5533908.1 Ferric enterobactin esterase [Citrobacter werkmanii]CAB5542058.1 Ferric enterobactin esterase [Citrobacter werkmanii]
MAVTTLKTGSEAWWQSKKGPEWEREENGNYRVTFWWRDPQGTEKESAIRRVWVYITGVTDHHQNVPPQSMQRINGTNVWCWSVSLSANWRGSYCFIPTARDDIFAALAADETPGRNVLREGWRQLLPQAIADPLNPQSWRGGRGHAVSALEMPDAPVQPGWDQPAAPDCPAVCLQWHSARLCNTRRVWVFTTGDDQPEARPLAILLDGQFWAQSMPVWPALASLTHRGDLPPAVYLLIDAIDTSHRSRELPCNADFWLAVQQELLPLVKATTAFSNDPQRTVVAGQSFGGLSALYAGLNWPARFGCVLSQSGSFWWPHRGGHQDGAIVEQLKSGKVSVQGLRIVLEAGIREPIIFRANQALYAQLPSAPQSIFWRQVDGGHDALCWRGGLMQGLMTLWQPLSETI